MPTGWYMSTEFFWLSVTPFEKIVLLSLCLKEFQISWSCRSLSPLCAAASISSFDGFCDVPAVAIIF